MKKLMGLMLLAAFTGCTTMVSQNDEALCGPRPTGEQAENAVKVYVDGVGLKDPGAAQVKDIVIVGKAKWYKGLVNGGGYNYGWEISFQLNGKNSYGGYVGFQPRKILLCDGGRVYWSLVE